MNRKILLVLVANLIIVVGCNNKPSTSSSEVKNPATATLDDVNREAAQARDAAATLAQQEKEKVMKDLKEQLAAMDAKIEELRKKGSSAASDARVKWDVKMAELDVKRKAAHAKLDELENSTSQAWKDIESGVKSAWDDLKVAFQNASSDF